MTSGREGRRRGARTWLGLDPGAMAPHRPGRVDWEKGSEQPISLPTTLCGALRMRGFSQGRREVLATVQRCLRALRAPKPWDQHPGGRVVSPGSAQGSGEDRAASHCDAVTRTHQHH